MLSLLKRLARRTSLLLHPDRREREMDEEMRFHIEMEARDLTRDGRTTSDAEREARVRFGGVERHKEDGRDARGIRLIEDLMQDIRYAWRNALAHPSFTIASLATLSLGIGASTLMYSFTRMNPVPFDNADRLVSIRQYSLTGCLECQDIATGNALEVARTTRALESVSLLLRWSPVYRGEDHSEVIRGAKVSHGYFRMARVTPLLGTDFLASDTIANASNAAMLSESMWRTRLGADPAVVGRDVVLDGMHFTVRGVIPEGYEYPERTDVWTVLRPSVVDANRHSASMDVRAIGRLGDGVSIEQAEAELTTIAKRIETAYPADFRSWTLGIRPLWRYGAYDNDRTTAIFLTAVGLVLLISCTNLAGLRLARLTRRRHELAVRAAMGAFASRITRQLLTETLLICVIGALIGVGLTQLSLRAIVASLPESVAPAGWTRLHISWHVFAFSLAIAVIAALAIGLAPALRFARLDVNEELRDGVRWRGTHGASTGERLRRGLVVLQLALSLVLVTAAGLLMRSITNMANQPLGLSTDHVVTMALQIPNEVNGARTGEPGYFDRLTDAIARTPGVSHMGAVAFLPLTRLGWAAQMFQIEGRPTLEGSGGTRTQFVTPGYFETLKVPLLHGRLFTPADNDTAHRVALINESLARHFFADDNPIGRVLVLTDGKRMSIVGVIGDVRQSGAESDAGREIVMPAATTSRRSMSLVVRTSADPAGVVPALIKAVDGFDHSIAVNRIRTMDAVADEFLAPHRVEQMLMTGFAAIALIIATMGLYAIMSYAVVSRMREFGVRLALGATGRQVLGLVLRDGLSLATIGVIIGAGGAIAAARLMRTMLYHVAPSDPWALLAAIGGIGVVALGAAFIPARRAMRLDPVMSLRRAD